MPSDIDEKTKEPVGDVLQSKHPDARTPDPSDLEDHDGELPDFVPLDITEETVATIARRLSGGAGPGGTDSVSLQHWLLRFGGASAELREAVAEFTDWLANDLPPLAAYRALMAGHLIGLDKCLGVRPVSIGETWRRLFAKCILSEAGEEATEACGTDQLADRM